jgi:hypothetical protein
MNPAGIAPDSGTAGFINGVLSCDGDRACVAKHTAINTVAGAAFGGAAELTTGALSGALAFGAASATTETTRQALDNNLDLKAILFSTGLGIVGGGAIGGLSAVAPRELTVGEHAAQLSIRDVAGVRQSTVTAAESGSLFSSGSAITNAEVVQSGAGLPRTAETVADVAGRAGVDLRGSTFRIIEDPDYLRYLDSQDACACAPYDLPGEIHLGPASFIDKGTLAAPFAHEQVHILQYAAGYVPGSGGLEAMEAAARAAEGPALTRLFGTSR